MSGPGLPLSAVADRLRGADLLREARGSEETRIGGVSQDSRAVSSGDLFLAWKGVEHDAHDFLAEAVAGGAVAAVVERFVDAVDVPQLRVADGRRAGALAADLVLGSPARGMVLVGVTGTNGKTTTTLLIRHILADGTDAAALGTLGLVGPDGEVRPDTEGLTTPGPVEVARRLRTVAEEGVEVVSIEASSHALEQGRLDALRFRAAVFTNLSRDHLDYHEDWDGYFGAKARLAELLEDDGAAVLNADEPRWRGLPTGDRRVLTFGIDAPADLRGRELELGPRGSAFTLEDPGGGERRIRLPLLGRFNVENALGALGAAQA
ncbi:MAG TPA: Mur ligase family protein, partial [Longimicrobiales bacterium]|nr:Mur ligase family protein [Longimicrobiales bacterium]